MRNLFLAGGTRNVGVLDLATSIVTLVNVDRAGVPTLKRVNVGQPTLEVKQATKRSGVTVVINSAGK